MSLLAVPPQDTPPSPFDAATIAAAGFALAGQPLTMSPLPPGPAWIDSNGGTLLQSELTFAANANALLHQINAPGSQEWTCRWFLSTVDLIDTTGIVPTVPKGSLFVRLMQDGPSAFTPPAPPPTVLQAVCGMTYPLRTFSDGVARRCCAAFAGTTFKAGMPPFIATPDNTSVEPGGFQPIYGDAYQVVNGYMAPSGVIVEIGAVNPTTGQYATAALPANG